ncbi:cysteine hydrolase family protein [Mangrovibacterium lignilyticum]|uniref:cysteine hydrolase family protein n=1 Tax=Mangrovibacterium lignilyticum TaxID=2668052 RepID=UPI0013D7E03B|nr:cysteine hydrolase family protein [Mangrovibacterium lignilyticum]
MKALVIIDMQKISFTPMTSRHDAEGVIERINLLSGQFRKNKLPVIFIQHDGSVENTCLPGTAEWELLPELNRLPDDLVISKMANDAFYETSLQQRLEDLGVDELVITGCATDFCVDATVKSALTRDYQITVVSDGHTTANRPQITARLVVDYFNLIWSELTPTKGKIVPMSCNDFLAGMN